MHTAFSFDAGAFGARLTPRDAYVFAKGNQVTSNSGQPVKLSRPPERTILEACIEVGRPVVFAVSIIMIVYLPILTLTGIEGKMFKPMALTVVFALLGSLILSLTYVTAAMTYLLRGHVSERESFVIRFAKRHYQTVLAYVTGRRRAALIIASALVLLSVAIFPWLGSEFIPRLDEGAFAVQIHQMADVDWCSIVAHFFALDCTRSVSPGKGVANRNRH